MREADLPLLSLREFSAGYNGNVIVKIADLDIRRGDFFAAIGANGSGKSTFLKTVAGLLPPVNGTRQFVRDTKNARTIGYIPQAEKLDSIFPITVAEVVVMGASANLKPGQKISHRHRESATAALRKVGLESVARRQFAHLSGGQKQRVLFARALMTDPALLVLDEPTSGVDSKAEREFLELLSSVNEAGVAVLMASHNLDLVREFAPQTLLFHNGKIDSGPTSRIFAKLPPAGQGRDFL